jgi:Mn-dependent DtxR family transcriptional regulator
MDNETDEILIPLTPAGKHYLLAVSVLNTDKLGARVTDIANMLGVSKPSVCTAIRILKQKNLVDTNKYGKLFLTSAGEMQALVFRHKYEIIKRFLSEVVGVNDKTVAIDAGAIVHGISAETVACFEKLLSV